MEHLPIVCEHTNVELGTLPRAEAIAQQAWCRSTNVFILNSRGDLLCHQRSPLKERLPNGWSTHVGGHVGVGETYETNALKELHEEAGVNAAPERLIQWRTTKHQKSRLWIREYVILHDAPASHFTPQPGEVEKFEWMSLEEILRSHSEDPTNWYAGTHDIKSEYEAMRAALVVAHNLGSIEVPAEMHSWHPVSAIAAA
ncbi:NUDIX domain-containing protein [Patescibacteria group bacterium]|nr:NUDIX domain-containing protein [Patescibacteria group bacterium]